MERFEMHKELWGPGEWQHENDFEIYQDDRFFVVIKRNYLGAWCGYVGYPKDITIPNDEELDVHGAVTYHSERIPFDISEHTTTDFSNHKWIGFDCAHAHDLVPSNNIIKEYCGTDKCAHETEGEFEKLLSKWKPTYKNESFAKLEVSKLLEQIKNIK